MIGLSKFAQTFAVRFLKSSSIHPICINAWGSFSFNVSIVVPQGSVLGPLLFLIINDFPTSSDLLSFYQFADDTTILYSSNTLANTVNVLNSELIKVSDCLRANKLTLNIAKTKCIYFEKKGNKLINISINNNNYNINNISINNNLNIIYVSIITKYYHAHLSIFLA